MFNLHPLFYFFNADRPQIPKDSSQWPDSWKKTEYKTYPRMPRIKLPEVEIGSISLTDAILQRKSEREFSKKPITLEELSSLLLMGGGIINKTKDTAKFHRAYPSGGARYPIEIYLILRNIENIKAGIYHYNVFEHVLEFLIEEEASKTSGLFPYEFAEKAAALFIFTMIPERSTRKYGNLAYKIGLIEAGHMVENLYLLCTALHVKCSALGAIRENIACELLDLDGDSEIPFYALACGK